MNEDMEKRTKQYIDVRDALKKLDERQKAERKPLLEIQERLAGIIRTFMDANKLENLRTQHGTCYTSTRYTASLADPDAFMKFVIANNAFEMMDRRANSTAVREYVEEHKQLPPGVNLTALQTVGVKRPSDK